jgi:two-component system chemotaxis response regulator CheY
MRILVADDASFMRITLDRILKSAGYEIVGQAANGIEAVAAYKKHNPDLVTMDVSMPEMDGVQAVKAIREIDPQARIVMVSAMGQEYVMQEAIAAGAIDFIVKPFKPDKVLETVGKVAMRLSK